MVVKYEFEESGRQYVLARFGAGLSLSQKLLGLRRAGRIWAYLPEDTPTGIREDFERGGLGQREERRAKLLEFIAHHLETRPVNCAILEDYLARPTDSSVTRSPVPHFFYRDEVYDYLVDGGHARRAVEELIAVGRSYRLTLVLSQLPAEPRAQIGDDTLLAIARTASTVILDAWHNEGEIYCELLGPADIRPNPPTAELKR
jgi:hypothetical protein